MIFRFDGAVIDSKSVKTSIIEIDACGYKVSHLSREGASKDIDLREFAFRSNERLDSGDDVQSEPGLPQADRETRRERPLCERLRSS